MTGRPLYNLPNATTVGSGDKFLIQQGASSKQLDEAVMAALYKDHATSYNKNPADGSAHNADDVAKNGGGSVQDFIDEYEGVTNTFVFEGDSITAGNTIGGYKYSDIFKSLTYCNNRPTFNYAVGGSYIASGDNLGNNLTDRYIPLVYQHRPTSAGGSGGDVAYLFVMAGTNVLDTRFGNKDATTVISELTAYTQQAMSDGFTVVLQTILPRISNQNGWNIQTEKYRLTVNAAIRRGTIPCDIVADTESFVNDVTSTAMFHDGIHPTALGSDMIAAYLNNVMIAGGSLELGNVIQGRNIQGLFESKDKTMIRVGSQYARTSLGTDYNENKNGFLVIENLNPTEPNSSLWMYETGVSADNKLKLLAVGDGLTGSVQAMAFARQGLRTWAEFGSVGQRTILGTPQSNSDSAPIYMQNLSVAGVSVSEKNWGWVTGGAADARPNSLFLRTVSDDFTSQKTAVEFKRSGDVITNVSFSCTIGTNGVSISPKPWALGSIKSGTGLTLTSTKYVEVEIGGTLVKLAVVNDPTVSP